MIGFPIARYVRAVRKFLVHVNKEQIRINNQMSKVDEDITNQLSDLPIKKKKTQEDKEFEELEVESTGGGFDAGGG